MVGFGKTWLNAAYDAWRTQTPPEYDYEDSEDSENEENEIMKEIAIGQEIRIRCVEDIGLEGCEGCCFKELAIDCYLACAGFQRKDGKDVHFEIAED